MIDIYEKRKSIDRSKEVEALGGWYHSHKWLDGTITHGLHTLESLTERFNGFGLPADLTGKTVLDIGAWDGWFSFEAERRGAKVLAIDCIEVQNFLYARDKLNSKVDYRIMDLFEIREKNLGKFDYVFFLGVLYHTKHPLLGLEIVNELTKDTAVVVSYVMDGGTWQQNVDKMPIMEFYETDELGGHFDNWFAPSVKCLQGLCRTSGFAQVDLIACTETTATIVCKKKYNRINPEGKAPELISAMDCWFKGNKFKSNIDGYVTCTFKTDLVLNKRQDVWVDIGGYGVPALYLGGAGLYQVNARIPLGLEKGKHEVKLSIRNSELSNAQIIEII